MSGRKELESVLRNPDVLRVRRGRFLREDSTRDHPSRCLIGEERGRDVRESVVFREFVDVGRGYRGHLCTIFEGNAIG